MYCQYAGYPQWYAKGIENVDFFLLVQEGPISIVINN